MTRWTRILWLAPLWMGCAGETPAPAPTPSPEDAAKAAKAKADEDAKKQEEDKKKAQVDRGKYLVDHVSACIECHTPRNPDGTLDMKNYLAGSDCFLDVNPKDDTKGCNSPRNLTNDETGLKNRTDDQIKDMFLNGKRPDGTFLNPFMPYWVFHNMTNDDADAIVAYLRTVPGINHTTPPNQAPWDVVPAAAPPLDPEKDIPKGTTTNESIEHGRYLAAEAGVCIECHTQHNKPGPGPVLDTTKAFAGGEPFGAAWLHLPVPPFPQMIVTRNLTPDATGLKDWAPGDIAKVLKQGIDKEGKGICPPMPVGPMFAYGGLTDPDIRDIAAYIQALPPIANQVKTNCEAPPPPPPGAAPPGGDDHAKAKAGKAGKAGKAQ